MKKHLFAIFTYFATFFISFFLVSLLTERPQTKATSCFPSRNAVKVFTTSEKTEQDLIRTLLMEDYVSGTKYFAGNETASETEELVGQMRSLDNPKLPLTVRKAYKSHTEAWDNYAKHLKRSKNHESSDKECIALNRDINETYNTLLLAAENYGVDFRR